VSWLALRTEPPRPDGARLVPGPAAPQDWPVARGTVLVDWRFEPGFAHLPLLDYAARAPWDAGVTLRFARDRLRLDIRQGPGLATATLPVDAARAVHGYLVAFAWDGPARSGRLALLDPDGRIAAETPLAAPPPLTMRDVTRICADRTLCRVAPGVAMVAIADHELPAGPWPGLTPDAPVMTEAGPTRLDRLRVGDLVRCTDGDLAQVRWLAGLELPAAGMLAPVRMLSPYMGLSRDISALGAQRFELTGSDVEYLFDTDRVRCTASQLLRSPMARPDPAPVLMRYVSPVLDRPALLDVAGLGCETLRPGPEALHPRTVLARMPRTLCPREDAAPPRTLADYEAMDLLHRRSAA